MRADEASEHVDHAAGADASGDVDREALVGVLVEDSDLRRVAKQQGSSLEYYYFEGMDRVAVLDPSGAAAESYLFDGIDHPLRIAQTATSTTAYYELDVAGNVRHLFASGETDLGGYRYTAFGRTVEDTTTITQPLRWKGRWFSSVAGGIYDVRARQWSPEMGVFLAVDEFAYFDPKTTLWGWPGMNPPRFSDPFGRDGGASPPDGGSDPEARHECFQNCAEYGQHVYWECIKDNKESGGGCNRKKPRDCTEEARQASQRCRERDKCDKL